MPDLSVEFHFWWLVRVFGRQLYIDLENTAFIRGTLGALDGSFPVPEIIIDYRDFNVGFLRLD